MNNGFEGANLTKKNGTETRNLSHEAILLRNWRNILHTKVLIEKCLVLMDFLFSTHNTSRKASGKRNGKR